jgi:hypothetical protein
MEFRTSYLVFPTLYIVLRTWYKVVLDTDYLLLDTIPLPSLVRTERYRLRYRV